MTEPEGRSIKGYRASSQCTGHRLQNASEGKRASAEAVKVNNTGKSVGFGGPSCRNALIFSPLPNPSMDMINGMRR